MPCVTSAIWTLAPSCAYCEPLYICSFSCFYCATFLFRTFHVSHISCFAHFARLTFCTFCALHILCFALFALRTFRIFCTFLHTHFSRFLHICTCVWLSRLFAPSLPATFSSPSSPLLHLSCCRTLPLQLRLRHLSLYLHVCHIIASATVIAL